jgi:hypothetical protein
MKKNHCLVADLGGLPMIDDKVNFSALATLACAVRQRLDNKRQKLAAYLQPELASACYRCASVATLLFTANQACAQPKPCSICAAS